MIKRRGVELDVYGFIPISSSSNGYGFDDDCDASEFLNDEGGKLNGCESDVAAEKGGMWVWFVPLPPSSNGNGLGDTRSFGASEFYLLFDVSQFFDEEQGGRGELDG